LLVTLLLLELGFRLFAPQPTALNVSQWDPNYGWRNRPGERGFALFSFFRMEVQINSLGMRDHETTWEKPPDTYRILGLGDSFAFGYGVAEDSCFLSVAERELAVLSEAHGGPRVEVLNSGVTKWGTAQEYLYLQREGLQLSPDAVVLAFCVDNDFEDNARGSVLRVEGDRLVPVPSPESVVRKAQQITRMIPAYGYLAKHSHLVNFLRIRGTILDTRIRRAAESRQPVRADSLRASPADQTGERLAITTQIMDSLVVETRRAGVPLLVLFVPGRWHCATEEQKKHPRFWDPSEHEEMVTQLAAHLDSLGVPTVYPLERLSDVSRVRPLYFGEGHLNDEGSRLVGQALAEGLAAEGMVPPAVAEAVLEAPETSE
jgi:lysophospholipase L1-like esterase